MQSCMAIQIKHSIKNFIKYCTLVFMKSKIFSGFYKLFNLQVSLAALMEKQGRRGSYSESRDFKSTAPSTGLNLIKGFATPERTDAL